MLAETAWEVVGYASPDGFVLARDEPAPQWRGFVWGDPAPRSLRSVQVSVESLLRVYCILVGEHGAAETLATDGVERCSRCGDALPYLLGSE